MMEPPLETTHQSATWQQPTNNWCSITSSSRAITHMDSTSISKGTTWCSSPSTLSSSTEAHNPAQNWMLRRSRQKVKTVVTILFYIISWDTYWTHVVTSLLLFACYFCQLAKKGAVTPCWACNQACGYFVFRCHSNEDHLWFNRHLVWQVYCVRVLDILFLATRIIIHLNLASFSCTTVWIVSSLNRVIDLVCFICE